MYVLCVNDAVGVLRLLGEVALSLKDKTPRKRKSSKNPLHTLIASSSVSVPRRTMSEATERKGSVSPFPHAPHPTPSLTTSFPRLGCEITTYWLGGPLLHMAGPSSRVYFIRLTTHAVAARSHSHDSAMWQLAQMSMPWPIRRSDNDDTTDYLGNIIRVIIRGVSLTSIAQGEWLEELLARRCRNGVRG